MAQSRKDIRSTHIVVAGNVLAVLLFASTCNITGERSATSNVIHYSGQKFAGSQACVDCHAAVTESHFSTQHFLTSRPADKQSVKGSFDPGKNIYRVDDRQKVVMEETAGGLFQVAFVDSVEVIRKQIAITIGSGRKGQTYLYWDSNALFQLPVSYYTPTDAWCNSPGYPTDQILFNRNIQARCLECHSTFIRTDKALMQRETFVKDQVMFGVDCERCHGPAADHVAFHKKYPGSGKAEHIINPARLTRQQRLDNCALCHSGIRDNFMPSFTFMVGDRLDDFSYPAHAPDSIASLDVHGNQFGLLSASRCFKMSDMDCSTCHDVHARETGRLDIFSQRCMNCHARDSDHFCKQAERIDFDLEKNCIDCHMPALPSAKVFLQAPDSSQATPFLVRTHLVGTYEEQIVRFLERMNTGDIAK